MLLHLSVCSQGGLHPGGSALSGDLHPGGFASGFTVSAGGSVSGGWADPS